jgi:hypothetical protein
MNNKGTVILLVLVRWGGGGRFTYFMRKERFRVAYHVCVRLAYFDKTWCDYFAFIAHVIPWPVSTANRRRAGLPSRYYACLRHEVQTGSGADIVLLGCDVVRTGTVYRHNTGV